VTRKPESERCRSVLILGLGASGRAAARLLRREGARVVGLDAADTEDLRTQAAELVRDGVDVRLKTEAIPQESFDLAVASPGIPPGSPWIAALEARGVPILSELEIGWRHCACRVLAVTGSNGKSTLVKLCAETLAKGGAAVAPAANYGAPLCEVAGQSTGLDWIVAEVSSFQLERVEDFRPDVGVLLNIRPNHLDRHGSMRRYRSLKFRLFSRMNGKDVGIVLTENLRAARAFGAGHRWVTFGSSGSSDVRYEDGWLRWRRQRDRSVSLLGTAFGNPVLGLTAAAAAAAIEACGGDARRLEAAAREFEPLPHRLQAIGTVRGVRFIDDSKATNLAAVCGALDRTPPGVRLIAGGILKEKDLDGVKELLAKKAHTVYVIGEAAERLARAWAPVVTCRRCGTLEEATRAAWQDARAGETVLLAPGCASFDQFDGFEDRGNRFAAIVRSIRDEEK